MIAIGIALLAVPFVFFGYAYIAYPALLWLVSRSRHESVPIPDPAEWPMVTITVPAYNEEKRIRSTIESLLQIDYPLERRQIVIASDGSTDGTDAVVREYASRGVELVHVSPRGGKTNAENHASSLFRGEIVVNTDESHPHAPALGESTRARVSRLECRRGVGPRCKRGRRGAGSESRRVRLRGLRNVGQGSKPDSDRSSALADAAMRHESRCSALCCPAIPPETSRVRSSRTRKDCAPFR